MRHKKTCFKIFIGVLISTGLFWAGHGVALAQTPAGWSAQARIPEYDDEARPPEMVADSTGTVHVFNYQPVDDFTNQAIFHRTWRPDTGWSEARDIILPLRSNQPRLQSVLLDEAGYIHLIFFDGNELGASLYYSRAHASRANLAPAWLPPVLVADNAGPLPSAAVAGDGQNLYVLYTGRGERAGLYFSHSDDRGETWAASSLLLPTFDDLQPFGTRFTLDPQGNLHAVWSIVDSFGLDQELYYARLDTETMDWSWPVMLAQKDEGDYKSAWPSIIAWQGQLMVVYMDGPLPPTRFMRQSFDWGRTWTEPVRLFPHVGEYEHAVLLTDGDDNLHIVLGNRRDNMSHGMWHGVWLGDRWSDLEPLVSGPKTPTFDPSAPRAAIAQGNILLAAWWTDTGGGPRNGAWYSFGRLDASPVSAQPLPTAIPTATPQPTPEPTARPVTPTPTPRPNVTLPVELRGQAVPQTNAGIPVGVAVAAVTALLLVIGGIYRWLTS